jgi:hypothetical protein
MVERLAASAASYDEVVAWIEGQTSAASIEKVETRWAVR